MRSIRSTFVLSLVCFGCTYGTTLTGADIDVPPTSTATILLRGEIGAFGAARASGKSHSGVDLVANQSTGDKKAYSVRAVDAGEVVYSAVNGSPGKGYGKTVIVHHGNGEYSLYAHLGDHSSLPTAKTGDSVASGQVIGYLGDPSKGVLSSGNVLDCSVLSYEKLQLHFEWFTGPKDPTGAVQIGDFKNGGVMLDPTEKLRDLGYGEYPPLTDAEKIKKAKACAAEKGPEA